MIGAITTGALSFMPAIPFPQTIAFVWLDAADTTTIAVSGTAVTQWNDKGSAGYNVTQSTSSQRPQSGTTTLNGKNVIAYDGGDVLLSTDAGNWKFLSDGTKYVMGLVVKVSTLADPENDLQVFSNIRRAEGVVGRNLQAESRGGSTGNLRAYSYNGSSYVYIQDAGSDVWTQDAPVVYTELNDATNGFAANRISSYFGTGSAIKTNTQSGSASTSNAAYTFGLGATDQALQGITGYIAELVIATGANATETNRVAIRDYLKTKWAI
jgi:hypothetical protein